MIPAFLRGMISRIARYRRQRILTKILRNRPNHRRPSADPGHLSDVVFGRSHRFTVDIDGISPCLFHQVSLPGIEDGKWRKEVHLSGWMIVASEIPGCAVSKLAYWAGSSDGCKPRKASISLYDGAGTVIVKFDLGTVKPKDLYFDGLSLESTDPLRFSLSLECSKCVLSFPLAAGENVPEPEGDRPDIGAAQ